MDDGPTRDGHIDDRCTGVGGTAARRPKGLLGRVLISGALVLAGGMNVLGPLTARGAENEPGVACVQTARGPLVTPSPLVDPAGPPNQGGMSQGGASASGGPVAGQQVAPVEVSTAAPFASNEARGPEMPIVSTQVPSAPAPILCTELVSPTGQSGIIGWVTIGPTCPVVTDTAACADRPYEASLSVLDQGRQSLSSLRTDAAGMFSFSLSPGTYVLRPESPSDIPSAPAQTVTVNAGRYALVQVVYDSGIR